MLHSYVLDVCTRSCVRCITHSCVICMYTLVLYVCTHSCVICMYTLMCYMYVHTHVLEVCTCLCTVCTRILTVCVDEHTYTVQIDCTRGIVWTTLLGEFQNIRTHFCFSSMICGRCRVVPFDFHNRRFCHTGSF